MIDLVGPGTLLTAIDYDFTEQLKIRLAKVPPNYKKLYSGKTVDQAIALAEAVGSEGIAFKTQRQYLGAFANVLKRGKAKKWIAELPADLKPVAEDKTADKDKRQSFSGEQLKSFFEGPFYAAVLSGDEVVKARPGFVWRYWLPILAPYSGMRGNEICQISSLKKGRCQIKSRLLHICCPAGAQTVLGRTLRTVLRVCGRPCVFWLNLLKVVNFGSGSRQQ